MEKYEMYEPEALYTNELKEKHLESTNKFFDDLTKKSGINVDENRATCKDYYTKLDELAKLNKKLKKLKWLKALFIFLCLVIAGIFLLIFVYKPKKKALLAEIAKKESEVQAARSLAESQMATLNSLFEDSMPAKLLELTTPLIKMDRIFDVKKFEQLRDKYGFWDNSDTSSSTLNLQSGSILGNPFVIFKDLKMNVVKQQYTGHLTITYTVGSGNNRRTMSQTLTATIEKPKPVYSKETYLIYGCEAADKLSFSREPSEINKLDEKGIAKYVAKHEKDLVKMAEKATKKGGTYTPLGNAEFELFFGGLDRDNEIQYRLLFTPLAQKSMLDVLKSKVGYGDDFRFIKSKGINMIQSAHSQGDVLFKDNTEFMGYDYDKVREGFVNYCVNYFKSLFFDFAPLLAIPMYQQYKTHEYIYQNTIPSHLNCFMHELIANRYGSSRFAHNETNTDVILKTNFQRKENDSDIVNVTAYSYKTVEHLEYVSKLGRDGRFHNVPVRWIEYVPLVSNGSITMQDLGVDNEFEFNKVGNNNVVYVNGVVINDQLNVDINQLKSKMKKD